VSSYNNNPDINEHGLSDQDFEEIATRNLDTLPWPFVIVSVPDYRCLHLNRAAVEVFRVGSCGDSCGVVGKQAEEVLPRWEETFLSAFKQVTLSRRLLQFTHVSYKIRKRTTYWNLTLTPNYDASDTLTSISCIAIESTKPRRVTRERERLADILEATSDFVITSDLAGHILHLNKAARDIFGISSQADPGAMSLSRCYPDWAYELGQEESIPLAMRDGLWSGETTVLAHDGKHIPVSQVIITHKAPDGEVDYFSMIARDISERKLAEQRREELEADKLDFHRRTILAATEGKLIVTEREYIAQLAGPASMSWEVRAAEDLGSIRSEIRDLMRAEGIEESRMHGFILACGEALTNALNHGGGGTTSFHVSGESLLLLVSDNGPGIEALSLPDVALTSGYSTSGTLGMGYKAMMSFADHVYLATGPTGTTVAVEVRRDPRAASHENSLSPGLSRA
jgi:PAS domain S-box-containing protein